MTLLHGQGEIIAERYQIVTLLGEGGMGSTYAAVDLKTNQRVAIKVVSLRAAGDWKTLELFEGEAQALATLNHPFIPHYLDYFQLDIEEDSANSDYRFYLVQELVEGESLAALVKRGWHTTEAEVKDIARQLLEILTYIHKFNPPIIHRDIKPQNVIRRADGTVYLVDFGAVQAIYNQTIGGSKTLVGTFGYMPVEQFQGKVYCASDLYSLGCTLIFLLTHRSPADLPQKRMKIDFRQGLDLSNGFATWLDSISEPMLEKRFQSATEALQQLQRLEEQTRIHGDNETRKMETPPEILLPVRKPKGTHIKLIQTATKFTIKIPHYHHKQGRRSFFTGLFTSFFATGCACIFCVILPFLLSVFWSNWLSFDLILQYLIILLIILYLLFQFRNLSILLRGSFKLEIKSQVFNIYIKGCLNNRHIQGDSRDLKIMDNSNWDGSLEYKEERLEIDPMGGALTEVEKRWVHQEIINCLKTWDLL
ncbi:MAG: serine/threonine protein kinase [Symploca sp. SIO2G7]|nr:serine/threonine protein kinase [Symploca sp. SIO2G7]